jgi:hypothetical protein
VVKVEMVERKRLLELKHGELQQVHCSTQDKQS